MTGLTYGEALRRASFTLKESGIEQPRFEAELLMAFSLHTDRLKLRLLQDEFIDRRKIKYFNSLISRRSAGEPYAYITGEKYFYGRKFIVNPSVLVPRPETELLVERALHLLSSGKLKQTQKPIILDMGTGSGIIGISLLLEINSAHVLATDYSPGALEVAKTNATLHGVAEHITFLQGDYWKALETNNTPASFDMVISNPPYINAVQMLALPESVSRFEPYGALYGGEDGLSAYRAILAGLENRLGPEGALLLEIGWDQQASVKALCSSSGLFSSIRCHRDLAGRPRVVEALV